jgi:hypothetical protein
MAEEQNGSGLGRVLLDPVRLQQQTKYKTNGLTVTSNNVNIMPRDAAGNIMLHENSSKNPLLIIEPVDTKIMLQSVLKVLDTRFEYFKFPVTIVSTDTEDLLVDLSSEVDYSNIEDDLKIPLTYDSKGQAYGWVRINTSYDSDWFYNTGEISSGFRQLQFVGKNPSEQKNAYVLTQAAIDTLREQKKTLRFKIHVQGRCSIPNPTAFTIRLTRANPKFWRTSFATPQVTAYSHHEDSGYPVMYMEYILDIDDMYEGDQFFVNAVSGNPGWTLDGNCWWEVRVVNIPTIQPLIGSNNRSGVYDINGGSLPVRLYEIEQQGTPDIPAGTAIEIGAKFPGSNTFRFKSDPNYYALAQEYTDKYGILG